MKKITSLIGLAVYTVGSIGGIGYACKVEEYFIAACVGGLAVIGAPKAWGYIKELLNLEAI